MKSKRKSLTGGKIPKRKRDQLKAQATYTPAADYAAMADEQQETARHAKRSQEQADKYNKNRWFFQKEKRANQFDGKPKKRKHNLNLP